MIQQLKNLFDVNSLSVYSIAGRKEKQEDSYYTSAHYKGRQLIFVADGVGGHGNGDFASKLCVDIFKEAHRQQKDISFDKVPKFLTETARLVGASILNYSDIHPEFKKCGTTLSGFYIMEDQYYTVNIGDSRVYKFSNGILIRETKDHSKMQRLIDAQILTEEEAKLHPEANVMTSALGQPLEMMVIDVKGPGNLFKGDQLLALSDGVFESLDDTQIEKVIIENKEFKSLAKNLVLKAHLEGSTDNITSVIYRHKYSILSDV